MMFFNFLSLTRTRLRRAVVLPLSLAALTSSCEHASPSENALRGENPLGHRIVELNSSVITIGDYDISSDRCVEMVSRAAAFPQSKIMFVPTLFWVQTGDGPLEHYCFNRYQDQSGKFQCAAADSGQIAAYQASMQRCFKKAVDAGLSIAVTPHLDDGRGEGRWRNILVFDPLEKKQGYSYAEAILYPLVDALMAVATDKTQIFFGMQGEMSATVFRHPKSWRQLVGLIKERVGQARGPAIQNNFKVGVSTNFNKLCGCVGLNIIKPTEFVEQYPILWEKVKGEFDLPEIVNLFETVDYFGMSSYPSLSPFFPTSDIESAISQFDFEFQFFGLSVNELIKKGKQVHFSEYGLGGGADQNGNTKAKTAAEAALYPFFGIFGSYKKDSDPWELAFLDRPSEVRDYQRYFYTKTLEYLRYEKQYKYRVDAAFLWNQSSWDVQAIYPASTSSEGSYRDPIIVDMINQHNKAAMAMP